MDPEFELTIIIPVFNEEGNLERVYQAMQEFLPQSQKRACVLFVNDGSADRSQEIIERICLEDQQFKHISFDKNYGLSAAIKAGFDYIQTPLTGYIDADLQTDPKDFNILAEYIDDYALVTGVRSNRKDSFVKNISSTIANSIRRAFTHDGMDDTGCPLKLIQTAYAKRIPMFNGLHRFLPAMVLLQGGRIIQLPVRHYPRMAGKSNFHLWNRIFGPLSDCFAYWWMKRKYINYQVSKSAI